MHTSFSPLPLALPLYLEQRVFGEISPLNQVHHRGNDGGFKKHDSLHIADDSGSFQEVKLSDRLYMSNYILNNRHRNNGKGRKQGNGR